MQTSVIFPRGTCLCNVVSCAIQPWFEYSVANKLTIRTGGGGFVFFVSLGLVFLLVAIAGAIQLNAGFQWPTLFAAVLCFSLSCFCLFFVLIQRIEINDQRLSARFIVPGTLPRLGHYETQLRDIEAVIIGPIGHLKYFANMPEMDNLKELIRTYENLHVKGMSLRWAVQFTPLIVVAVKDEAKTKSFAITTKPFSKDGVRRLFSTLNVLGVQAVVDPQLKL